MSRRLIQNVPRNLVIFMTSSTNHVSGVAGASGSMVINLSKDGAAFAVITPAINDRGNGFYSLALTNAHVDTLNDWALHVTATGCDPTDLILEVVQSIENQVWDANPANHTAINSFGEMVTRPTGAVVADGGNTAATFKTNLASAVNDFYKDAWCTFLDGALAGQTHKITSYVGSTKFLGFTNSFTAAPVAATRFLLVNK